ncbi:hypothetical protein DER46DRAFT_655807 [Fusarium sp. MPI-SDFR-AT-0072]|nr:hypothetical protein DER46DRAFT_655807 [Fusarium sp. MPI-SDFR-AT-0072]
MSAMVAPGHVHGKKGSTTSWCALVLAIAPAYASHLPLAAMSLPNLVWLKFEGKAGRFSK